MSHPRYAVYFAPAPGSRWWRFGSEWLGRDAISGRLLEPMSLPGMARDYVASITRAPRHYGFHATLKPPFALAEGLSVDDLQFALRQFCAQRASIKLGQLSLQALDGFLALRVLEKAALREFAAECVQHFDFLRAPLSTSELARRRAVELTPRQEAMLTSWGYPHVMDEFRFHLTLTERLSPEALEQTQNALAPLIQALNAEPLYVDALCLFEQATLESPFQLTRRYSFDGTVTRYEGTEAQATRGRLFYVVGPSGAGKDSLLRYVRDRLGKTRSIAFAHRYITRAADAGGENHVALDDAEFTRRERVGAFALCWESHQHRYGIGVEIDQWLERGLDVIVNGSRAHLQRAFARYPTMTVISVTAPPELLRERLHQRGRETATAVETRLTRAPQVELPQHARVVEIVNDATLDRAGEQLMRVLLAA